MRKTGFCHHTADLATGDLTIKLRVDATSFNRLIQSETSDVPEGRQEVRMKRLTGLDGLLVSATQTTALPSSFLCCFVRIKPLR